MTPNVNVVHRMKIQLLSNGMSIIPKREILVFFRNLRETNKNIEILLFGNDEISINENSNIFNKVRAYIRQTKRL